jgi:hypothetical protein
VARLGTRNIIGANTQSEARYACCPQWAPRHRPGGVRLPILMVVFPDIVPPPVRL